jgi:hypothetical protein
MNISTAVAIVAASLLACTQASAAPDPPSGDKLSELLEKGRTIYLSKDYSAALAVFETATAQPEFKSLDDSVRSDVLTMESYAALETKNAVMASDLAREATSIKDADRDAWMVRLFADIRINDGDDALQTLTHYARVWPTEVGDLGEDVIAWVLGKGSASDKQLANLTLVEALYDAHWQPRAKSFDDELYDLAVDLLARGNKAKAAEVARTIREGRVVLQMRVDHRFDAIPGLDPVEAAKSWVETTGAAAAADPRSLEKFDMHLYSQVQAGDGAAALAGADQAIARSKAGKAFDDQDDQLIWTFNYRAMALNLLGRHDEALSQLADASKLDEHGRPNVSQVINLGGALNERARPSEALAAVAGINSSNTSAYGLKSVERVRACAFAQLKDDKSLADELGLLRAAEQTGSDVGFNLLLCTGDLDRAAAALIGQLADPDTRGPTLAMLQDFQDPLQPLPLAVKRENQIAELRSRPAVLKAIEAVGVIRAWPFPSPSD